MRPSFYTYNFSGNKHWNRISRHTWNPFQWHHYGCDGVLNHRPHDCLLNRLFRRRSKKTSKLHVTGPCEGNSPVAGEFPGQMASNAKMLPFDDVIMQFETALICKQVQQDRFLLNRHIHRLISTMGFPILVRCHFYIEFGPRYLVGGRRAVNTNDINADLSPSRFAFVYHWIVIKGSFIWYKWSNSWQKSPLHAWAKHLGTKSR